MLLNFLKQNMHRIMRVLVNQVGIIIFALIMNMTATVLDEKQQPAMTLVASLFSICFYLFLVFYAMREEGGADGIKIDAGRMTYDSTHGLKIGLCATAPNYVFVLLMLVGLLLGIEYNDAGTIAGGTGVGIWTAGYYVTILIQSMYAGVLKSLFGLFALSESLWAALIAYAVTPLLAPVASWLGYIYGRKNPASSRPRYYK